MEKLTQFIDQKLKAKRRTTASSLFDSEVVGTLNEDRARKSEAGRGRNNNRKKGSKAGLWDSSSVSGSLSSKAGISGIMKAFGGKKQYRQKGSFNKNEEF